MRILVALALAAAVSAPAIAQTRPTARPGWYVLNEDLSCTPSRRSPDSLQRETLRQNKPSFLETAPGRGVVLLPRSNSGGAAFEPIIMYPDRTSCAEAAAEGK